MKTLQKFPTPIHHIRKIEGHAYIEYDDKQEDEKIDTIDPDKEFFISLKV